MEGKKKRKSKKDEVFKIDTGGKPLHEVVKQVIKGGGGGKPETKKSKEG